MAHQTHVLDRRVCEVSLSEEFPVSSISDFGAVEFFQHAPRAPYSLIGFTERVLSQFSKVWANVPGVEVSQANPKRFPRVMWWIQSQE